MIYIFCALYHEAEPLIREYGLKKKTDETCFPVFFDEEENILLTVTGCGMNAAAAAVARICTKRTPQPEDFLVNIGTCAWISKISCFLRIGTDGFDGKRIDLNRIVHRIGSYFFPVPLHNV